QSTQRIAVPLGGRRRTRRASGVGSSGLWRDAGPRWREQRTAIASVGRKVGLRQIGARGGRRAGRSPGERTGVAQLSPTIHPSSRLIVRWPYAAFASECVTWTIVVPSSLRRLN